MKKIVSVLLATAVALSVAATSIVSADAAPLAPISPIVAPASDVIQVQEGGRYRNGAHRLYRGGQRDGYYRGYRGNREYRSGYRRHGDRWYPAAAFAAGALITGAIIGSQQSGVRVRNGNRHEQYCYDRYRSYRASDNTFQPNSGPRQQCNSPY